MRGADPRRAIRAVRRRASGAARRLPPPAPRDAGRASAAARRCRSSVRRAPPAPRPVRECPAPVSAETGIGRQHSPSPPSGERVGVRGRAASCGGTLTRPPRCGVHPLPHAGEGLACSPSRSTLFATGIVSGPGHAAAAGGVLRARGVEHEQAQFGRLGAGQRAAQPFLLDRVGALAQPGRVGEHDRVAGEVDRDLDHVARRAGDRRGDRRLAPRELVQQARFAGVRRPDDRHRDAVAQPLAAMPVGQMRARSRRPAKRCPPRPAISISGGRSSSGKSIAASRCARRRSSRSPQPRYSAPSAPSSWRNAWRRCASVSAAARSATASAWVRSSLPFRKARRVNSPGSARRNPCRRSTAMTEASTARLPCRCSSATSSPVALRGPGNHSASASSSASPLSGIAHAGHAGPCAAAAASPTSACSAAPARGTGQADDRDRGAPRRGGRGVDRVRAGASVFRDCFVAPLLAMTPGHRP